MTKITLSVFDKTLYSDCLDESKPPNLVKLTNNKAKLAAFDWDSTLVKPKSGKFSKGSDDWVWAFPRVAEVLKKLEKDGYHIVIFSNQKGIKQGKTTPQILEDKLNLMVEKLGWNPFWAIMLAAEDDYYRKPRTGMWEVFKNNSPVLIDCLDLDKSFYCGDAAGRPKGWSVGAPKDFSRSDLYFAQNIGLPFKLPEELFLSDKQPNLSEILTKSPCPIGKGDPYEECSELNWDQYKIEGEDVQRLNDVLDFTHQPEMVLLVGLPASGKSTLSRRYADHGYTIINMDTLKTKAKCLKACKEAVKAGKSVLIDNTNPSVTVRQEYLDIARNTENKNPYYLKAFRLKTPDMVCQHLNHFRVQSSQGQSKKIPMVAYRMCASKMTDPTLSEGLNEVIDWPFCLEWDVLDKQKRQQFLYHYDL